MRWLAPATRGARWFLVRVRGRSMLPTLAEGDVLLCRRRAPGEAIAQGSIAVLRLPADRPLAVKRITSRQDEGWWAERDNPAEGVDSWLVGAIADQDVVAVVHARLAPAPRRLRPAPTPRG